MKDTDNTKANAAPQPAQAALSASQIDTLNKLIDCCEILDKRPRPMCRDCADEDGTWPNGGLQCDMRKLFADARAILAASHQPAAAPKLSPDAPDLREQWARVDAEIGGKAMHVAAFDDGVNCAAPVQPADAAPSKAHAMPEYPQEWKEAACKACEGLTMDHFEDGWTALGLSKYAKSLEDKLASKSQPPQAQLVAEVGCSSPATGKAELVRSGLSLMWELKKVKDGHAKLLEDVYSALLWMHRRLPLAYKSLSGLYATIEAVGQAIGYDASEAIKEQDDAPVEAQQVSEAVPVVGIKADAARQTEAHKLARILFGMVEGDGRVEGADIYADGYSAPDGDVYVLRAAELLIEQAAESEELTRYVEHFALATQPTAQAAPAKAVDERAAFEALQKIAKNETEVFDEDEGCNVIVSMDAEEMVEIARAALAHKPASGEIAQ